MVQARLLHSDTADDLGMSVNVAVHWDLPSVARSNPVDAWTGS